MNDELCKGQEGCGAENKHDIKEALRGNCSQGMSDAVWRCWPALWHTGFSLVGVGVEQRRGRERRVMCGFMVHFIRRLSQAMVGVVRGCHGARVLE